MLGKFTEKAKNLKDPISKEVSEHYMKVNAGIEEEHPLEKGLRKRLCKKTDKALAAIKRNQGRK